MKTVYKKIYTTSAFNVKYKFKSLGFPGKIRSVTCFLVGLHFMSKKKSVRDQIQCMISWKISFTIHWKHLKYEKVTLPYDNAHWSLTREPQPLWYLFGYNMQLTFSFLFKKKVMSSCEFEHHQVSYFTCIFKTVRDWLKKVVQTGHFKVAAFKGHSYNFFINIIHFSKIINPQDI